jgi:DNA-binding FrmR family transcriptional regulator
VSRHHSHPDIIKRLKRAHGHLAKVIAMIESGEPCVEVAQQLHAVEKSITNAKRVFVEDHIEHCLDEKDLADSRRRKQSINEFKSIAKYL